jgi:class 3 adenylate cyclase
MTKITCLPDRKEVDIGEGDTILEATLRANIAHAHACGGFARCSTCRVWVLEGLDNCAPRTEEERSLADSVGFQPEVRLACQTQVAGNVKLRRLVLDETDLEITNQLSRKRLGRCGEVKDVVVLFSDIRGFTALSETLSGYDVIFILNRYFFQVGDVIERNGGYIVDFYGDGVMALFGLDDDPDAPLHGVKAGLEILHVVDHLKPYMKAMYDEPFEVGVGMHYGPAVIGSVGSARTEKLTGVGETINIASKIEAANKTADTRLLVSDELYEAVRESVEVRDFIRIKLPGTSGRWTLYEIAGLDPTVDAALKSRREREDDTRHRYGGARRPRCPARPHPRPASRGEQRVSSPQAPAERQRGAG